MGINNGVIICWMTYSSDTSINDYGKVTLNFPVTFSTQAISFVTTALSTDNFTAITQPCYMSIFSLTTFGEQQISSVTINSFGARHILTIGY